ncbi:DUF1570 domain-containing protein [Pseudoalteromonas sp. T1lg76]|uniref:DUF1570 domain-containing protein n=1 Tax=Pseudoalteromonas sp. T1lg76 TaxID=2077103 RepID=UPI000CF61825|nr:DUF1570 domain-containing protein [Pseudoalteromonas sp. T1lg76]
MERRIIKIFICLAIFLALAHGANQLQGKQLELPEPVAACITWLQQLFGSKQASLSAPAPLQNKSPLNTPTKPTQAQPGIGAATGKSGENSVVATKGNKHNLGQRFTCTDTSLGELKVQQFQGIYTWTDSQGVRHVSDQKPDFEVQQYRYEGADVMDYFALELIAPSMNSEFRARLESTLNGVFKAYSQVVGREAMRKVDLRLHVLPTRSSYLAAIRRAGSTSSNSVGSYFGRSNEAYIEYRGDVQTMRTAIHEAVHAINHAVLGNTPSWLNEGLAEYFEHTEIELQLVMVHPNPSWVRDGWLQQSVYSPGHLWQAEALWQNDGDSSKLYRSSWAFISYLLHNPEGRKAFKRVVRAQVAQRCQKLSAQQVQGLVPVNIRQGFSRWQQGELSGHRY